MPNELPTLGSGLLKTWCDALLACQRPADDSPDAAGGFWCPACGRIHGRSADAIYPLLYMADKTGDSKYRDAALRLYDWMERTVSLPDGSWLCDLVGPHWVWTTVFGAMSLAEALHFHGKILDARTREAWTVRLKKAGDFLYKNMDFGLTVINYPATCSATLYLLGTYLHEPDFQKKGKALASRTLDYLTRQDKFLFGEGDPNDRKSPKGCYPVDLGYNVEESLPALALYALAAGDREVLDTVMESLKTHLEFMLPDGAWDNSWGTRNFKWTWWGSRTSDGCLPAFALLANRHPEFYRAALANTALLQRCTKNGLLYGGPHNAQHGEQPCVHHTFCHAKSLTTLLDRGLPAGISKTVSLPRESEYGVKEFKDIQTWLISKGRWRATVTGYDWEYKKGGHPSGGALSLLWHQALGPVLAAGMNEYQLWEPHNMQADKDPNSLPLALRLECKMNGTAFTNINDYHAAIDWRETEGAIVFTVRAKLVDPGQTSPPSGEIPCTTEYVFRKNEVEISAALNLPHPGPEVTFILPVISSHEEKVSKVSENEVIIKKAAGTLKICANLPLGILPTKKSRVFNFVPGFEAIPFFIKNPCKTKVLVKFTDNSDKI